MRTSKIDPLVRENVQSNENLVDYYAKCQVQRSEQFVNFSLRRDRRAELRDITLRKSNLAITCRDGGQDVAEYAVMLAVILVIVIGMVRLIGANASTVFSQVGSGIQ
jgi:Flp pilus assembly pilin Flp